MFPPPFICHISQIIVDCLFHIVTTYVLNWSSGHWLLNDALHSAINMSFKLKEKFNNPHVPPPLNNLWKMIWGQILN
jgi:hypothetical protein